MGEELLFICLNYIFFYSVKYVFLVFDSIVPLRARTYFCNLDIMQCVCKKGGPYYARVLCFKNYVYIVHANAKAYNATMQIQGRVYNCLVHRKK